MMTDSRCGIPKHYLAALEIPSSDVQVEYEAKPDASDSFAHPQSSMLRIVILGVGWCLAHNPN